MADNHGLPAAKAVEVVVVVFSAPKARGDDNAVALIICRLAVQFVHCDRYMSARHCCLGVSQSTADSSPGGHEWPLAFSSRAE
jgi:hypothetical protein